MSSSNIVAMHSDNKVNEDFENLKNSLSFLDWTLQTQTLIRATGLPLGDILSNKEADLPFTSLAGKLGHKKLESFITGSNSAYGIGWAWSQWEQFTTAFRYKSFYDIYVDDPVEVVAQFDDVTSVLGHVPANSAEYHSAKDRLMLDQRVALVEKHSLEVTDLKDQIANLEESESKLLIQVSGLKEAERALEKKYLDALNEADRKIEKAKTEMRLDHVRDLEVQKGKLEEQFAKEREQIHLTATAQIEEAKEQVEQMKNRYKPENFVSIQEHNDVKIHLENEQKQVRDLLVRLNSSDKRLNEVMTRNGQLELQVESLQKTINEQELLINTLQAQLNKGSHGSISLNSDEIARLEGRIASLEHYLERFRESSSNWKGKYTAQKKQAKEMQSQIKKMKSNLKKIKASKNKQGMIYFTFAMLASAVSAMAVYFFV